jgi:hypothetical protein
MITRLKIFCVSITFSFLFLLAPLKSWAQNSECKASCNGNGAVQVDLEQKCMCINKDNCFKVNIGNDGPSMTTQGHGKLGKAEGAKYSTLPNTSSDYDKDAIDMGIPENTAVGKWIHKTQGCGPGGNNATLGCIAVPCEHWKDVKEQMGKDLDVCGGDAPMSRGGGSSSGGGDAESTRSGGQ